MNILLLHPPHAKSAEPPAGLPLLAATLREHGCSCTTCDLNLEGLLYLIDSCPDRDDTWSKRAKKNRERHIQSLRSEELYKNTDRYRRAVTDLNRVVENSGKTKDISLTLSNYQDNRFSPQSSEDLLAVAKQHEENLFYPFFSRRLIELVEENPPEYIGISLNYLSQALCSFAIAGFIKKIFPEIKIIMGGGLVTTWLQNPEWTNPFTGLIDHMIAGPGEAKLVEYITGTIPDSRTTPDYHGFTDENYLAPGFILPYATSMGCFWKKCSFCPETSENNPYLPVATPTVIEELHNLIKETSPCLVHLLDNAVSPAVLKAIIANPFSVPWYGFARFTEELTDESFCQQLRNSGCVMLKLGLESGSSKVLEQMNKGINLELASKALKALHKAGIMTYVYLLFGTPSETEQEARETLHYVKLHHENISFLNLAIFNLPSCSPENDGLTIQKFSDGDLSIYNDFRHPKGWDRKKVRRFLDSEFRREPVIQAILKNDPFQFTSNHAAFFTQSAQ